MEAFANLSTALATRYELLREIGAGGMATVYLAKDLRHDRPVALKVLKPELGAILGVERFLSEIRVTANLQHPNLLPLFDSGEAGGQLFYVMPYVEGESLRARLTREKQLTVDDALRIATSMATALDYAHRHGVIHRDLKPENVLLHEGEPLIADFGIALAVSNAGGERITQTGLSLGTPQYMSPEQATGDRQIDARTDIYSLAAVTYEMLSGEPPHIGATAQAIIARVLMDRPRGVRIMRPSVSEQVEAALQRGLEKLPADRQATAKEFADALRAGTSGPAPIAPTFLSAPSASTRTRRLHDPLLLALVATLVVTLAGSAVLMRRSQTSAPPPPVYLSLESTPTRRIRDAFPAISADGRLIAFAADSAGVTRLYLRAVDQFEPRVLAGTESASPDSPPFFSPDGAWLAFVSNGKLRRIRVVGPEQIDVVANATELSLGGSWSSDGSLIFAPDIAKGLVRIASDGSEPTTVTTPNRAAGEIGHALPDVLPNGKGVLYGLITRTGWSVAVHSFASKNDKILIPGATMARFIAPGRLIYVKDGRLLSVGFDPERLVIEGRSMVFADATVAGDVRAGGADAYYAVAARGSVVFVAGERHIRWTIVRVDRSGKTTELRENSGGRPRFSPNGDALIAEDSAQITMYDLKTGGTKTRLTSGSPRFAPLWSPDGSRFVYTSYEDGPPNLFMSSLANPGTAKRLIGGDNRRYASSWSRNGYLAFTEVGNVGTGMDIWAVPIAGDSVGKPIPLVTTEANDYQPSFSPDGNWLAYTSERTGRPEVYVQAFPSAGTPQRVSRDGGDAAVWNPNGHELLYRHADQLMSVSVSGTSSLNFGEPHALFTMTFARGPLSPSYDVSPDGQAFVVQTETPAPPRRLNMIVNWRP